MGIITNNKGEVVGEFEDTLEDWRQADEVEAGLRRECQAELARLRAEIERLRAHLDGANQLDVARIQEIKRQREALEQIKELETLEDGKLSTSGEIADRALCCASRCDTALG